jgi:hypothetical protein
VRVTVSRTVRVQPGDEIIITGELPTASRLGRLFVFAKQGEAPFSPYVYQVEHKMRVGIDGVPRMMTPLMMRLTEAHRLKRMAFVSDIDGWLQVMQEVDRAEDPKARIRLKRKICPYLPWTKKIFRMIDGMVPWKQ